VCHFGLLLTWTSEEGFPLYKEEVAEYFLFFIFYLFIYLIFEGGHRL